MQRGMLYTIYNKVCFPCRGGGLGRQGRRLQGTCKEPGKSLEESAGRMNRKEVPEKIISKKHGKSLRESGIIRTFAAANVRIALACMLTIP